MLSQILSFGTALLTASTLAQTQADKDAYPNYAKAFDKWGITWEPIKVKTEDGWTLTMIHMTGKVDTGPTKTADRPAVIFQHGMGADGTEFIYSIASLLKYGGVPEPILSKEPPMAFQLMEMGFDVYLANNSGTPYSMENDTYTSADPEFWMMDWRKFGVYDMPAFVGEIKKRNGGKKVAYVGHSQGTTQAFAGMALIPQWYDDNISQAALLGPCVHPNWEQIQYNYVESDFEFMRDNDIYVLNGGSDWEVKKEILLASGSPNLESFVGGLAGVPVQTLSAYFQCSQTQRFQEYEDNWNWDVPPHTDLMDFGKTKKMQVAMYVGLFDRTCPVTQAEFIRTQLGEGTVSHYVVAPFQGHSPWGMSQGEWFVNDLQQALMNNADL